MAYDVITKQVNFIDGQFVPIEITNTYASWYDDIWDWIPTCIELFCITVVMALGFVFFILAPIWWPFWKLFGGKNWICRGTSMSGLPRRKPKDKLYKINVPEWRIGGRTNHRHIVTPFGWLGLRRDCSCWTVTGINENGDWQDREKFGAENEAEKFILESYEKQVKKFLTRFEEV